MREIEITHNYITHVYKPANTRAYVMITHVACIHFKDTILEL